jgi:hypothetical protein
MKRDLQDENFEEFLKRNADNLRMKVPERVWQNLSGELNKNRRRFGAGLSAFLLATAILGYLTISNTSKQALLTRQPAVSPPAVTTSTTIKEETRLAKNSLRTAQLKTASITSKDNRISSVQDGETARTSTVAIASEQLPAPEKTELSTQTDFTPTIIDDFLISENNAVGEKGLSGKPSFLSAYDASPLSIESVINSYHRKNKRFQTEFHFTPTISYRKLSENKSYLRANSSFNTALNYAALYNSVNDMVTHKPDIGFELGVTEKYSVSQKLRVRAGFQFNVNRYDIKAFKSPYYLATIALNTRNSSRVDSVYSISSYSNVDGSSNKSSWLQNLSFQVSAPVGVELALKGTDKMQFGVATTIQPTYVLGDRAYLITTDYKSYTQVPWLLRRWNVNTALETFVSYQSGKTRWQVGPQVRYQLLSSFISNYPVKENLFDFGLKIGISVNK